jgi:microcystin-dependent protein
MSSIFPADPEVNDEFQGYRFNGTAWKIIGVDLTADYPEITDGYISEDVIPITIATKTYADTAASTAVSNVIDSSPNTLDTLNELAAALGDDPNFATTITSLIAEKMSNVPGMISQYAGTTSPNGWMICDGSEVSRTTYSALYSAIGNSYGSGNGSTTFNLPNLKGRVPVGLDSSQTEFDTRGETGGSKTSVAPHDHSIAHDHASFSTSDGAGNHQHSINDGGHYYIAGGSDFEVGYSRQGGTTSFNGAHNHAIDVPNFSGTSGAASAAATSGNLQPYIVVNYIIKF